MYDTKLLQLLSTLTKEELEQFTIYLQCFHQKSKSLIELLDFLSGYYGDWMNEDLHRDNILSQLNLKITHKAFSNRHSKLYLILLEYLQHEELKKKKYSFHREWLTIGILGERRLNKLKEQKIDEIQKELNTKLPKKKGDQETKNDCIALHDSLLPLRKISINEAQYYSEEFDKYTHKNDLLTENLHHLDQLVTGLKLKYACELLWRSIILKHPGDNAFFEEILSLEIDEQNQFQLIYSSFFKALLRSDINSYKQSTALLMADSSKCLSETDRQIILIYLINFAARQARNNGKTYGKEILGLYKFGLDEKLLIKGNEISRIRFTNIVDVACKFGDVPFARDFVKQYKYLLPTADYDHTIQLAQAVMMFAEAKFDAVLAELQQINFKHIDQKFRVQSLELCSLFEIYGIEKITLDKCNAFKRFLDRNNIVETSFIKGYRTFIKVVEKLLEEEAPKEEIFHLIDNAEHIFLRIWLLEKLENYKQRYK